MPSLNNWSVIAGVDGNRHVQPDPYTPPELITQHLRGVPVDDHRFNGSFPIGTSKIVSKRAGKIITHSGTEYELLDVDPSYEIVYPDAKNRLFNSLQEDKL